MSNEENKSFWNKRKWILLLLIVGVGSYTLGARSSVSGAQSAGEDAGNSKNTVSVTGVGEAAPKGIADSIEFEQFWELWGMLKSKYYKQPIDEQKMLYGAMSGLTAALGDPYTVFFEPVVAEEFSKSLEGKFEGIGAEIGIKENQLQIIAPLPESPAEKAGLMAGDAILAVSGTSTEGMSVEEAVSLIRGDKGTTVVLSVGRLTTKKDEKGKEKKEAKKFDVSIVRDTIVVKSVRTKYLDGNIALIEISHFNADTSDLFAVAADEVTAKGVKGIVLDLRNDPGGYLDRATAVAGEWVGDAIVVTERRKGVKVDEFHGTGKNRLKGIPTVVLVNEGSASASEIVAGALQDYGVAKLVGKKTFGKGSVQDYTELQDGTAAKITVAEWLTPKDRFINGIGIEPDVVVERTEEDFHAGRDPQLDKAVELLGGPAASSTARAE
jgi:carboxyl-terminal processing protease